MPKWIDIGGKQFGNWLVGIYLGGSKWLCTCLKCEVKFARIGHELTSGTSTQCLACCLKERTIHGHSAGGKISPTYISWCAMLDRCYQSACNDYDLYGGSGIIVCERWRTSFKNFLEDMGVRPSGFQLDRVETSGNYEPENCRWVTPKQNCQNRRNNKFVILDGQRIVLCEAERKLGVRKHALRVKLERMGWPNIDVRTVSFEPVSFKGALNPASKFVAAQVLEIRQAAGSVRDLASRFSVSKSTIRAIRNRDTYTDIP